MKKVFLALAMFCLFAVVGCSGSAQNLHPIVGVWEGDGIIGLSAYDVRVDASDDGTIRMDSDQVTHSTTSMGINFEGTWKRIKASDIPGTDTKDDDSGSAYKIDFNGVTYYAIVSSNPTEEGEMLVLMAFTDEGKMDLTKPLVTAYPASEKKQLTKEEIEAQIAEQPVRVTDAQFTVYDENYKSLYPDFISATVLNESGSTIKGISIGFVAWDENGLPVTITAKGSSQGYYYAEMSSANANIPNGAYWNEEGIALSALVPNNITQCKAIVVSYKDFDGNSWTNPLLEDWQAVYEDQPLS